MIIRKRKIRAIESYLGYLRPGTTFVIGVRAADVPETLLHRVGFTNEMMAGESVLPAGSFGPVSRYNAEGKFVVHKDQPMETAYRMAEWHWEEWRGRYDKEEQSKIVDVPYQRYPRTFSPPPAVELSISKTSSGEPFIVAPPLKLEPTLRAQTVHTINLFLEIFNQCEVLTEKLEISMMPLRRVNWRILPPGQRPWERLREDLDPIIEAPRRVIGQ